MYITIIYMNFITNLNNENDNGNNIFFEENINTDNVNGNEDDEFLDENMIDDFQKKSKSQELYEKLCLINFNDNEIDLTKYNNNIIANTLIIYIIKKISVRVSSIDRLRLFACLTIRNNSITHAN